FNVVHGARGTAGLRRAFSLRVVGDDARYVQRSGRTSPPFDGHGMVDGQRLREDWFPMLPHSFRRDSFAQQTPIDPDSENLS
ncbi:MAG: hypothetical protein VYD11_04410, partial [Actinomycetota bacterium]|nr:hypothetical protein [Actinomycetota bacterium]MED5232680.1 hypothetical protein [Actinomycetota bacterium]MEE3353940.1 hypothetical protein [Actinomycetota bacterium]